MQVAVHAPSSIDHGNIVGLIRKFEYRGIRQFEKCAPSFDDEASSVMFLKVTLRRKESDGGLRDVIGLCAKFSSDSENVAYRPLNRADTEDFCSAG